ncbi:Xaa-Pro aminopeptidase 2 [Halocaridina rubra]|uniref:Xaa-Pro aminopeptidase 2 n=1 Tax=Halocaridina rubra TaxID=373956 RepID=A0AAN9AFL4_HALRR
MRLTTAIFLAVCLLFYGVDGSPPVLRLENVPWSSDRIVTLENRTNCGPGDPQPPSRVDTTERVAQLRQEIANYGVDAYIIPTDDEHQSEYVADADLRRQYISGFSGSAGTAAVTMDQQALWTDGRYFLQADDQLDCNWLFMKSGLSGVPSITGWLLANLPSGARVGADPKLFSYSTWLSYSASLQAGNIEMFPVDTNLIDIIWTDRPSYVTDPAFSLGMEFAGKSWQDKVTDIQAELTSNGHDMVVLTALDETAWTLNLRGSDIPYNPVFRSYVLVGLDRVELFTLPEKVTQEVTDHLPGVVIKDYDTIFDNLAGLENDPSVNTILISGASFAIYNAVPASKRATGTSPVRNMKAMKNAVEQQGMRNAHLKDAAALCSFMSFMESEMAADNYWDELTAASRLDAFRAEQADFMGLSFVTISGYGANGAIIHYEPTPETNIQIEKDSLYLLDSGGQYLDGTTDVTRTLHYGTPTSQHIEAYTRVLKGTLDFADLVYPYGTTYGEIDILARRPLYNVGLDYRHGTSHGVGMFLFVHENSPPYYEIGWFGSDEPGYYQDGDFGVRIENVVTVVQKNPPYNFYSPAYGFEVVTLVPYEPKLINVTLLTPGQCESVNVYHQNILDVLGPELISQGRPSTYDWLVIKTAPLDCSGASGFI